MQQMTAAALAEDIESVSLLARRISMGAYKPVSK
jgi:hypothetical protein